MLKIGKKNIENQNWLISVFFFSVFQPLIFLKLLCAFGARYPGYIMGGRSFRHIPLYGGYRRPIW